MNFREKKRRIQCKEVKNYMYRLVKEFAKTTHYNSLYFFIHYSQSYKKYCIAIYIVFNFQQYYLHRKSTTKLKARCDVISKEQELTSEK